MREQKKSSNINHIYQDILELITNDDFKDSSKEADKEKILFQFLNKEGIDFDQKKILSDSKEMLTLLSHSIAKYDRLKYLFDGFLECNLDLNGLNLLYSILKQSTFLRIFLEFYFDAFNTIDAATAVDIIKSLSKTTNTTKMESNNNKSDNSNLIDVLILKDEKGNITSNMQLLETIEVAGFESNSLLKPLFLEIYADSLKFNFSIEFDGLNYSHIKCLRISSFRLKSDVSKTAFSEDEESNDLINFTISTQIDEMNIKCAIGETIIIENAGCIKYFEYKGSKWNFSAIRNIENEDIGLILEVPQEFQQDKDKLILYVVDKLSSFENDFEKILPLYIENKFIKIITKSGFHILPPTIIELNDDEKKSYLFNIF